MSYTVTYTVNIANCNDIKMESISFSRSPGLNLRSGYHPPHQGTLVKSVTYAAACGEGSSPTLNFSPGGTLSASWTEYKYSGTDVIFITKSEVSIYIFGPIPLGTSFDYYYRGAINIYIEEIEHCTAL